MKDIFTLLMVFVLVVHFYKILRQRYLNRHNKCARCGVTFDGIGKYSLTPSYHTFLFCKEYSGRIKKMDMHIFLVSGSYAVLLIVAYLFFRSANS